MAWTFEAELIEWRGPAPFVFAPLPVEKAVQRTERIAVGDAVTATVRLPSAAG
ncbi:MAG: hypothetical protein ACTMIR_12730 [Cellulomonadaceae bacterium]